MKYKFGIYQSSGASCIFYREDEDGNQSTFNLFSVLKSGIDDKKTIFALVDNEHVNDENWFGDSEITIQEIFEAFDKWASNAPIVFELDAQNRISNFLKLSLGSKGK